MINESDAAPSSAGFRRDIEGLRAVAVVMVLIYHGRLGLFPGGYVGVDVFFVISGYLITSLLLRELAATRTVSLTKFWARRIRRLMPASGLVLVATLVASRLLLDGISQRDVANDVVACALFVGNIHFWKVGTDYLAQGRGESPLLHYWSLAVEEQFYFVWPILLMAITRLAKFSRLGIAWMICGLWAISLFVGVRLTSTNPIWAYFMLPARAWELLSGAALALVASDGTLARLRPRHSAAAGLLGLVLVLASGIAFDNHTQFPGRAAIVPVAGTLLVIIAGTARRPRGLTRLLERRPLQWIGARSYGIYLWHLPILVLAERRLVAPSAPARLALVASSLPLAALTYRMVENPIRRSRRLARAPAYNAALGSCIVTIALGASALLLAYPPTLAAGTNAPIATIVTNGTAASNRSAGPTPDASHDNPPALAPMITANEPALEQGTATSDVPSNLKPSLLNARNDLPIVYADGCVLDLGVSNPKPCVYGDIHGRVTVVLFGDSHAAQWMPAVDAVAKAHGWRLVVQTKKACPSATIPTDKDPNNTDCAVWRQRVFAMISQLHPDLVVVSSYRYAEVGSDVGRDPDLVWSEGLDRTLARIRPSTAHILLLGDSATPLQDVPSCLASRVNNVAACMETRSTAVRIGRLAVERQLAAKYSISYVPTSDWMCTATACPVIVGNVLMYRDNSHLTATAALLFSPYIAAALTTSLA